MRIPYLAEALGVLLVAALAFGAVQTIRLKNAEIYHKDFVAAIKDEMIEKFKEHNSERNKVETLTAQIGNEYNRGVRDADKLSQVTIARLNADLGGVRKHWANALRRADTAEAALAGGELDAAAAAVSTDIGGILRGAAAGDAQVVSLQDQVNLYLCQVNGEPFPGYKCQ